MAKFIQRYWEYLPLPNNGGSWPMTLVDSLETQLATARASATHLFEAVVAELTAGNRVEGERSRKPSNRIASVKESARP
ncbi:MAG: hypothetical protein ABIS50_17425 [Luteolibacter sp.]|uniref:hypothetical protein n=1 Tax=Luteolibacter sp. TaxID=1962973 RepID=UPI003267D69C